MMLMSEETMNGLNELIRKTFQMNSFCDNIAYDLDYYVYSLTSDIIHHSIAHKFPEFADNLSELMIKLNARPIRKALIADERDYNGNLKLIFEDMSLKFEEYRQAIIQVIQLAEYNDDFEVKIALEDFSLSFIPYRKQIDIWKTESERYEGDEKSFDARIKTFTTVIPIVKAEGDNEDE